MKYGILVQTLRIRDTMKYISLFSGIEAASVAWEPLDWEPVVFADFEDFPSAVLKHHYPTVPNLGDVTKVNWNEYKGKAELMSVVLRCRTATWNG